MRTILVAIAAALLFAGGALADTWVRTESHTDGFYAGGTVTPPDDSFAETWIGDGRMAYVTDGRTLVVNQEKNLLLLVNHGDSTFAETPLPLDTAKLFSEQDVATLQAFKRQGTVRRSADRKKIGAWDCTGYDVNDWIVFEGGRVSERDVREWVTTDVSFDLKRYRELLASLLRLSNFSDDYADVVLAVDGFPVATEQTRYQEGTAIRTTSTVVKMEEKDPPAGLYEVPEGFTKKESLTLQDLRD